MRAFERRDDVWVARMEADEIALMSSLAIQIMELLGGEAPEASDPLEDLLGANAVQLDHTDPVIDRLFPTAYDNDVRAAEDFRRFTEEEARRGKVADAQVVLTDLAAAEASRGVSDAAEVVVTNVEAWLRTVNVFRLSLAVRLGIMDEQSSEELAELPDDDPRSMVFSIYEWLGWVLESLLAA